MVSIYILLVLLLSGIGNTAFARNWGIVERDTTVIEMTSKGIELSYSVTEIKAAPADILKIR